MQVTRKSHRWPFVVALVGLLVFCLTVPRYWRTSETAGDMEDHVEAFDRGFLHADPFASMPGSAGLPPTLENLIAAQNISTAADLANDEALFAQLSAGLAIGTPVASFPNVAWPTPADVLLLNPLADELPINASQGEVLPAWLEPYVAAAMRNVGRHLAEYSPPALAPQWIRDAANLLGVWTARWSLAKGTPITPIEGPGYAAPLPPAEAGTPLSTLRLLEPEQRLAMREPPVEEQPTEQRMTTPQPMGGPSPQTANAVWSSPEVLLAQVEHLTHYSHSERWAIDTLEQLRALVEGDRRDRTRAAALLAALSESSAEAVRLAELSSDERLRVELLRAHWGLQRRLDCWTVMRDIRIAAISEARIASRSLGQAFNGWTPDRAAQQNLESISADLESYERFRDPQMARQVAQAQRQLRTSTSDLDRALADAVEENYRNANVRIAISAEMLNRFLSQDRVQSAPVHERIAGTPIRGQSETVSTSRVTFQPAVGRWQMRMQTDGVVDSATESVGKAKVYTHGSTQFTAQTPIIIGADGSVVTHSTDVTASNCAQLIGVSTGIDWVPLIGAVARNQVVQQYQKKRPRAKSEIEFKVANRTREQVEARAGEVVSDVRGEVKDRLTDPLARFGIEITPLEMTTTNERIVARLRIASGEQLAAHTPRPRALSDSLASMQIHESAMTNAAVALELNGERLTASQLQDRLRDKLPRLALEKPPQATDDTFFQFAPADTVRFRVDGGRLELVLAIAEFSQPGTRIRNFIVHAFYVPVINGLTAELVRDGALGIEGAVGGADRARLHNVFKVVLAEDRRLPIFRPDDPNDGRLTGLMITQLVLEDGWLGISIGPAAGGRTAERQRSLR